MTRIKKEKIYLTMTIQLQTETKRKKNFRAAVEANQEIQAVSLVQFQKLAINNYFD